MLHFNRGITEYQLKLYPEAANDFKNSVSLNPFHPSSHQSLAYCVYDKNKVAGMLALSVFLMLEPEGKRAEKNLSAAEKLKSKLELFGNAELTKADAAGFFTEFYIPFFKQLNKDKQLLTACYIINATSDDPKTKKWLDKNKQTVKEFYDWLKDYKWTER